MGLESAGVVVRFGEGVEGWEVGEFAFFSFLFFDLAGGGLQGGRETCNPVFDLEER